MAAPHPQPDLDTVLTEIRQALGDTLSLANICAQLPRSHRQLLPLLKTMLRELRDDIQRALPSLPNGEGERHV